MRPTRPAVLVTLALVAAVLAGGALYVADQLTPTVPPMPWSVPVAIAVVALGVLVSAASLRRRLRGAPGARPVDPLAAARMAALAKACSHTGAALAGIYAGAAGFLLTGDDNAFRRGRLALTALSVLAALLLVAAGLVLERVCRVPPSDDEPPPAAP